MDTLFGAVSGTHAFDRLRSLVKGWKDRSKLLFNLDKGDDVDVQLVRAIDNLEGTSRRDEFLRRFVKAKLVGHIDKERGTCCRVKIIVIDNLLCCLG